MSGGRSAPPTNLGDKSRMLCAGVGMCVRRVCAGCARGARGVHCARGPDGGLRAGVRAKVGHVADVLHGARGHAGAPRIVMITSEM